MQQVRHSFLLKMISDSLEWAVWGRGGVAIPGGPLRTGLAKMGKDISIGWARMDWVRSPGPILLGLWVGLF